MEIGFHEFPSGKQYVFVKSPGVAKSPRVFLRNIIFLQRQSNPAEFAIVREWQAPDYDSAWEPPKGQMEWKEFADSGLKPGTILSEKTLAKYMREGVMREMVEEAKVLPTEIKHFQMIPLAYTQPWPESRVAGAHFRYQFWTARISDKIMLEAQKRMSTLVSHPDLQHVVTPDAKEKDAIVWWSGKTTKEWSMIRGAFSQKMTRMFVAWLKKHGVSNP
jgi:hypothetical protein